MKRSSILESLPINPQFAKPSRSGNANLAIRRTRGKLGVTKYAHSASLAKPAERNPPPRGNPARHVRRGDAFPAIFARYCSSRESRSDCNLVVQEPLAASSRRFFSFLI